MGGDIDYPSAVKKERQWIMDGIPDGFSTDFRRRQANDNGQRVTPTVEPSAAAGTGRAGGPFPPPGDGQSLPGFPGSFRLRSKTPMPGGRLRPRWKTPNGRI